MSGTTPQPGAMEAELSRWLITHLEENSRELKLESDRSLNAIGQRCDAAYAELTRQRDELLAALKSIEQQARLYRTAGDKAGPEQWRTGLDVIATQARVAREEESR